MWTSLLHFEQADGVISICVNVTWMVVSKVHVIMEKSHVRNLAYHLLPGVVTDMIQPPNKIYTF